jgi:diguanylate cyclase (GGDEF)-like protein
VRNPSITTVAQLELLAAQAIVSHARLRLLDSLRLQASRDPLTGLGHQASLAQRMSKPTTGMAAVLLIDIDDFKQINDTLGHAAGDHVLLRLVESMRKTLRPDDDLVRIGGDEFVAVLGVGAHAEVSGIARRLCTAAHGTGCTVSIGTALIGRGEAIDDALSRADAAM